MYKKGQLLGTSRKHSSKIRRPSSNASEAHSFSPQNRSKPTPLKNKESETLEALHVAQLRIRELENDNTTLRRENAVLHKTVEHQNGLVRKLVTESTNKQRLQAVLDRIDQEREFKNDGQSISPQPKVYLSPKSPTSTPYHLGVSVTSPTVSTVYTDDLCSSVLSE